MSNFLYSSDGSFQKTVQLPDTITAWVTRGFALSPTNGLGIAYNIQVRIIVIVHIIKNNCKKSRKIEVS